MTIEQEIKDAEAALEAATNAANDAHTKLIALYVRRSEEKFGIKIGDRVRETRSTKREGIVTSIRPDSWGNSKPWVYGLQIKKDGATGNREITFYDWELVR